ncbi:PDZ domain-containing protein [Sabulicella glaciei]|uniref:PDZ domain-containing protein n=1 Tax=Sabulicella glaciei TaxID=2984948 RepID=UPI0034A002E9
MPGPGMVASDLSPDSARCRLFARATPTSGYSYTARGSARFVAGAMAGAALAEGLGNAVAQNQNFNDCMLARGWRIAPTQSTPSVAAAIPSPAQSQSTAPGVPIIPVSLPAMASPPSYAAAPLISDSPRPRRRFGVRVTAGMEGEEGLAARPAGHGLRVLEVFPGGVGYTAGLQEGDVLLAFDGEPIHGASDMQRRLSAALPGSRSVVAVWRNGVERLVPLHF